MKIIKSNIIQQGNHMPMLVSECVAEYEKEQMFTNPKKIVEMLNSIFHLNILAEEYVYMLAFTSACELISVFEVSHGTGNASWIGGKEVMTRVLLSGASAIVIVHNHPSGNIKPSEKDIFVTSNIKKICEMLGIVFMDHIIIGGNEFYAIPDEQTKEE